MKIQEQIKETFYQHKHYMIPVSLHEYMIENFDILAKNYKVQTINELSSVITDELYIMFLKYLIKNNDILHKLNVLKADSDMFIEMFGKKRKDEDLEDYYFLYYKAYNDFLSKQFPQKNYGV